MDNAYKQLMAVAKQIKEKLQEIAQEVNLKNQNEAPRNQEESEKRNRAADIAVPHVPVEIHSFPAPPDEDAAYKRGKRTCERKRFTVDKWTLGACATLAPPVAQLVLATMRSRWCQQDL